MTLWADPWKSMMTVGWRRWYRGTTPRMARAWCAGNRCRCRYRYVAFARQEPTGIHRRHAPCNAARASTALHCHISKVCSECRSGRNSDALAAHTLHVHGGSVPRAPRCPAAASQPPHTRHVGLSRFRSLAVSKAAAYLSRPQRLPKNSPQRHKPGSLLQPPSHTL